MIDYWSYFKDQRRVENFMLTNNLSEGNNNRLHLKVGTHPHICNFLFLAEFHDKIGEEFNFF